MSSRSLDLGQTTATEQVSFLRFFSVGRAISKIAAEPKDGMQFVPFLGLSKFLHRPTCTDWELLFKYCSYVNNSAILALAKTVGA